MRSLLNVNVLIALLDADHTSHRPAMAWFSEHASFGKVRYAGQESIEIECHGCSFGRIGG